MYLEKWLFRNCRDILGTANDENVLTALFLLKKTQHTIAMDAYFMEEERAYREMFNQCQIYNFYNPFVDRHKFIQACRMLNKIDEADLEILLSMEESEYIHVPQNIFKIMAEQIQPKMENILIAEGQKFAPFLKELIKQYPYCQYIISAERHIHFVILKDIFEDYPQVIVQQTSIYEHKFLNSKFDLILSLPTMGRRNMVDMFSTFICREYEMVALENLLLHLAPSGKLAIVMPGKITFGGGRIANLRNFVQKMYCLEEISELPNGVFSGTGIKTYLLIISTGKTEDIIIKRYGFEPGTDRVGKTEREIILLDDTSVISAKLEEQGDWNIDRLFAIQDEDWQRFMKRDIRIKLKEVAQVFRGKNISRKDSTGNIGVINISNIGEYDIDYSSLEYISESERKISSYILENGDVLLPARGTAIRTAVFRRQPYQCIASSNIIIIRPRQDLLDSTYLKIFLDSPLGGKILISAQQGTVLVNLSYRDLQEIEIPFASIEEQKKLTEEYIKELNIYLTTIKSAQNRWQNTLEKLRTNL